MVPAPDDPVTAMTGYFSDMSVSPQEVLKLLDLKCLWSYAAFMCGVLSLYVSVEL